MTGDGGEYLRAEDLRELGDDSLPGQYLDGMNYLRFSLEGTRTDRYIKLKLYQRTSQKCCAVSQGCSNRLIAKAMPVDRLPLGQKKITTGHVSGQPEANGKLEKV